MSPMKGHMTQLFFALTLTLYIVVWPIFSHKSLNIASSMSYKPSSAYGYFEGQG